MQRNFFSTFSTYSTIVLLQFWSFQLAAQGNNVTITVDQPISCYGDHDGRLTATTNTSSAIFAWSNGKNTPTIENLGAGTYTVTVTDAAGGSAVATQTLVEPALLTTSIASSGTLTCTNVAVNLAALPMGGTQPFMYAWSAGGVDSVVTTGIAGSISLAISDAHACVATAVFNIPSDFTAPDLAPLDSAVITCEGGTTQLRAMAGSTTAVGYSWTTMDGQIISGANSPEPVVGAPGIYHLQAVYYPTGCEAEATAVVDAAYLHLVTSSQYPYYIEELDSLTVISSGGAGPVTYEWLDSSGLVIANTPTLYTLYPGVFSVVAVDSTGCTFTLEGIDIQSTVGVSDAQEAGFSLFPNPANDQFTIQIPAENETILRVFNPAGQLIFTQTIKDSQVVIATLHWPPGIYHLQLTHRGGVSALPIAITR